MGLVFYNRYDNVILLVATMKANTNDGERITLRLEQEDLTLIDEYIEKHREYSSRSHLARIAIRSMIEGDTGAEEAAEPSLKRNTIIVEIPRAIFEIMEDNIERGEYTNHQAIIEAAVRERFLSKEVSAARNAEVQKRNVKSIDVM
jgi:Arc/MetJ-type ribon-helix-helix transcriptional regulator